MKAKVVSAGNARLKMTWTGITMSHLGEELEALLLKYGLELTGRGHNLETGESDMVFRPRAGGE